MCELRCYEDDLLVLSNLSVHHESNELYARCTHSLILSQNGIYSFVYELPFGVQKIVLVIELGFVRRHLSLYVVAGCMIFFWLIGGAGLLLMLP